MVAQGWARHLASSDGCARIALASPGVLPPVEGRAALSLGSAQSVRGVTECGCVRAGGERDGAVGRFTVCYWLARVWQRVSQRHTLSPGVGRLRPDLLAKSHPERYGSNILCVHAGCAGPTHFGLRSVYVPPSSLGPVGLSIVPGTISRGSLGFRGRLPAERGPGTG